MKQLNAASNKKEARYDREMWNLFQMDGDKCGKVAVAANSIVLTASAILGTYYAAGAYYGWNAQQISAPASEGVTMTAPPAWIAIALFGATALLLVATITLIIMRQRMGTKRSALVTEASPLDAHHGEDHDRLLQFVHIVLAPACLDLVRLQERVLSQIEGHQKLKDLAKLGLYVGGDHAAFKVAIDEFVELSCSPPKQVTLLELIAVIHRLENKAYRVFGHQLAELEKAAGIDPRTDRATADVWNAWHESHLRLVKDFDVIKTSSAYDTRRYRAGLPSLYRPGLASRWGEVHEFKYDPN